MGKEKDVQKLEVKDFWNQASCGEDLYLTGTDLESYEAQSKARYSLEPYISDFAKFNQTQGLRVLEIGVGLGADHQCFARAGAELYGIDLTKRAVKHTQTRFNLFGLKSILSVGDAENLQFPDGFFDEVYSWGVLHHSPDTPKAITEVYRVLKCGGLAKIMIYHKWSMVGLMLWLRYALFMGRPWYSLKRIYSTYLESPGTKAYSIPDAYRLFSAFSKVQIKTVLTHGDLLESEAGQRHAGLLLRVARRIWPRRLIRHFLPNSGLFMLIEANK
jgi:SAM-dependent methyltransferase